MVTLYSCFYFFTILFTFLFALRSYKEQYAGQLHQQKQKMKKDPNAPKKPLSPYFLFWQDERLKVKAQFPDYSITEEAKEVGRRWKVIDPALKQAYQQKYQGCNSMCFPRVHRS